jgi:hypothetical protein
MAFSAYFYGTTTKGVAQVGVHAAPRRGADFAVLRVWWALSFWSTLTWLSSLTTSPRSAAVTASNHAFPTGGSGSLC